MANVFDPAEQRRLEGQLLMKTLREQGKPALPPQPVQETQPVRPKQGPGNDVVGIIGDAITSLRARRAGQEQQQATQKAIEGGAVFGPGLRAGNVIAGPEVPRILAPKPQPKTVVQSVLDTMVPEGEPIYDINGNATGFTTPTVAAPTQSSAAQTRVARVVGNPDIAGAFVNKYGSKAEGLRPVVANTTNGGLEDFMKATKGMNLEQLTSMIGLKPVPTKPPGYKDAVAGALSAMAAQDYYAVINDETATDEQKLAARAKYSSALQQIMSPDPAAYLLEQLGQQSE